MIYSGGIPVAFTMNNIKMTWGETGEIMAKGKAKLMRSPGRVEGLVGTRRVVSERGSTLG